MGALRPVMEGPLGNGGVEMDKKPRFCFQISESANPVHLVISDDDAKAVLDLVSKTGLCDREPADVRDGGKAHTQEGRGKEAHRQDTESEKERERYRGGEEERNNISILYKYVDCHTHTHIFFVVPTLFCVPVWCHWLWVVGRDRVVL